MKKKNIAEDIAIHKANKAEKDGPVMRTYGVFKQVKNKVTITDLPIGIWTYTYRKSLEKLRADGKIKSVVDHSGINTVNIEIELIDDEQATYKSLKLIRSEGLSNMVLIDRDGFPTRYKNTQEIMEKYFQSMIQMFSDLKTLKLKEIMDKIDDCRQRLLLYAM